MLFITRSTIAKSVLEVYTREKEDLKASKCNMNFNLVRSFKGWSINWLSDWILSVFFYLLRRCTWSANMFNPISAVAQTNIRFEGFEMSFVTICKTNWKKSFPCDGRMFFFSITILFSDDVEENGDKPFLIRLLHFFSSTAYVELLLLFRRWKPTENITFFLGKEKKIRWMRWKNIFLLELIEDRKQQEIFSAFPTLKQALIHHSSLPLKDVHWQQNDTLQDPHLLFTVVFAIF